MPFWVTDLIIKKVQREVHIHVTYSLWVFQTMDWSLVMQAEDNVWLLQIYQ